MAKNVRVIDHGWNRIKRAVDRMDGAHVKVGIRAGPSQGGVQVVDYAVMNEFGTEHIEARPFMRHTADTQEDRLREYARRLVPGLLAGTRTPDDVLMAVALWYQAAMRRTVRQSRAWAKPNAPATIAMKGSSVPLVDHGVLIDSIDFEIKRR